MTAREAVRHLRKAALKMKGKDAEAVGALLDDVRRLEQTLDLSLDAGEAALKRAPAPTIEAPGWSKPRRSEQT